MAEKLATYEDLEERLHKIFGEESIFSLADVIDTLEMELSEPDKKHPVNARILTYEEANKWQEYKDLEEQGLLVRLPVPLGSKVYWISTRDKQNPIIFEKIFVLGMLYFWDSTVFATREEAEKKLEEMEK